MRHRVAGISPKGTFKMADGLLDTGSLVAVKYRGRSDDKLIGIEIFRGPEMSSGQCRFVYAPDDPIDRGPGDLSLDLEQLDALRAIPLSPKANMRSRVAQTDCHDG